MDIKNFTPFSVVEGIRPPYPGGGYPYPGGGGGYHPAPGGGGYGAP